MTDKLAIIIPAYKSIFLQKALASLINQTNQNFNIYIGDDASPENLERIIDLFPGRDNIYYKKFENNLGGIDLIKHWERCIDLSNDEEWIWLFSDDDLIGPTCVDKFLTRIPTVNSFDIYHFNIKIINENDAVIEIPNSFTQILSIADFIEGRINSKVKSYAVEYIFRKQRLNDVGGFKRFDLAWGSDDATWIKIAGEKGIYTLSGDFVYWRKSNYNITPNISDKNIVNRKINSLTEYVFWLKSNYKMEMLTSKVTSFKLVRWFLRSLSLMKNVSFKNQLNYSNTVLNFLKCKYLLPYTFLYLLYKKTNRK